MEKQKTEDLHATTVSRDSLVKEIVERERAEEELRKYRDHLEELVKERTQAMQASEEKYRVLFETAKDAIFLTDDTGKFIDINQKACESLGYSKEELLKLSNRDIDADPRGYEAFLKSRNGQEKAITFEVNQRRKDGTLLSVEVAGNFFTSSGHLISLAIARDITKRKRAEDALRESEDKLKIQNQIADIFLTRTDNEMYEEILNVVVNVMASKFGVFGYIDKKGALVCPSMTKDIWDQCQVEDKDIIFPEDTWGDSIWGNGLRTGKSAYSNKSFKVPEGHLPVDRCLTVPIVFRDKSIGLFIVANKRTDYTEPDKQKLEVIAEQLAPVLYARLEKKRAEKKLRTERDKFQGIIAVLGEGMYIVNHDYIIEYQNNILKERFGDITGKKCHKVYRHSDRPCKECRLNEVIKTGEILNSEFVAADGRNYDVNFSPFTDMDGSIKALALAKNVTEKKRLQAETMRVKHLAALGELASGIAHEINNPINGIINYAQILKDQYHEQGQNRIRSDEDIPNRIIKEGDRIAQIVKNLLSFARDRKNEYSPALVKDILSDTLGLVKTQIIKDGIKISVDFPSDLPRVKARSREIQQAFLNILSNARYVLNEKFPGSHEDKVLEIRGETIELEGQMYVRTTFYDKGVGISADILDKICNPFFSTKPQGKGTGLGLSISHGIIKNHGGRLWFESVEGEYTRVMVDIPVDSVGATTGRSED